MVHGIQPDQITKLAEGEQFRFGCNPEVECFNECCRQLDLALTPYDVLRLRKNLGISSAAFLEKYALIEHDDDSPFPQVYLAMNNNATASCPFVEEQGCRVYKDRPGACRTYPLGRGAYLDRHGRRHELHVLLTEPHCKGFDQSQDQTAAEWTADQKLEPFNELNDEVLRLLRHPSLQQGKSLTAEKVDIFIQTLYNLDEFRRSVLNGTIPLTPALREADRTAINNDDIALLRLAIRWVRRELFAE